MPQNPQWARDLKKQGINYAVLRYVTPAPISTPPAQQQGTLPFGGGPLPVTVSTGAGPDGVVQPHKTAMIDMGTNPPSKYHEGELITISGNGVRNITPAQKAAMGNMQLPGTVTQQSQMDCMKLPGYETGGVTVPKEMGSVVDGGVTDGASGSANTTNTASGTDGTDTGALSTPAVPAGYTAQRSGLSTVSSPSELSLKGKDAVSTGLGLLSDTAQGKNQYLKDYGNQQLADQSASAAAGNAASMAAARRSGVSTPMLTTISQEATRNNESANNALRSNIYSKQQEAALNAVSNLVNVGQQVRTYEDVTLPTTQQTLENAKTNAQNATRQSVYNLVKERNLAGVWGDSLVGDAEIRAQVKSMLGETASEDDINREIGIIESAMLDQNREVYNTQVDNTVSDMIENGYDLSKVLNDETLLKKTAGYLRINDLNNVDNLNKVKEEIVNRYTELGKSDSQRAYDNIVNNVIKDTMPELLNNKDFTSDMKSTIGDLMTKGIIDADGKVISDTAFDWPWNDPDTYFKYHDWNGNKAYGGNYDQTQPLSVSGNGTTYKTSSGKPVTMADMNAAWNSPTMTSVDRENYFDTDGKFLMDKFLKDKGFKQGTDGTTFTTVDEFENKIVNDEAYSKDLDAKITLWNDTKNKGEITEGTGDTAQTSLASKQGKFVYYDENGVQQVGVIDDGTLGYIWQQFSDAAGLKDGELLDVTAFNNKWKNGEGWRVDKNGNVLNLRDKDAIGGKSDLNTTLLSLKVDYSSNQNGAVDWGDKFPGLKITDQDITDIVSNQSWKDPKLSQYIAEPAALERMTNATDIDTWFNKNEGKIYIGADSTPYIVYLDRGQKGKGAIPLLWKIGDGYFYKYSTKTGSIVEIGAK